MAMTLGAGAFPNCLQEAKSEAHMRAAQLISTLSFLLLVSAVRMRGAIAHDPLPASRLLPAAQPISPCSNTFPLEKPCTIGLVSDASNDAGELQGGREAPISPLVVHSQGSGHIDSYVPCNAGSMQST
jgi:hypothetical protein